MAIFQFFQNGGRHLDFQNAGILKVKRVKEGQVRHRAKFRGDR